MEYPKLYEEQQRKLDAEKTKRERLTALLTEARESLKCCIESAQSKDYDLAPLFEAYFDDNDDDEWGDDKKVSDPQIAQGTSEGTEHSRILASAQKKADAVRSVRNRIRALDEDIRQREDYLKRIKQYNPSVVQSKTQKYLTHFRPVKPEDWQRENEKVRHDMGSQTNSRLKIFMEMFVRPEYRGLPRYNGEYKQMDLDKVPLTRVPFDPAYLSDTFLREFGFAGAPKGSDLPALKGKERLIPAVKSFLEKCVHPLPKTESRTSDKNYRLLLVKGHSRSSDGKIINPHMDAKHERRIPSVFRSAFSCHRQADHVFKQYQSESKFLTDTLVELRLLHARLCKLMGVKIESGSEAETEKNEIRAGLKKIAEALQSAFNVLKTMAHDSVRCSEELRDSLDRENFGASLARLIKALSRLDARKEEIFDMSLASPENAIMLEEIINSSSRKILQYEGALQGYLDNGHMTRLEALDGTLDEVDVRPFNLYAAKLTSAVSKMRRKENKDDWHVRLCEATKAMAVIHLFKVQKDLEEVLLNLDRDRLCGRETASRYLESLSKSVEANQITHYRRPFAAIRGHLDEVKVIMDEDMADDAAEPAPERNGKLKDTLKEIDFERLLIDIS